MQLTILEKATALTAKDFKVRLEKELKELKGQLTASISVDGLTKSGWTRISVAGTDNEIVGEIIANRFGLALMEPRLLEVPGIYEAAIIGRDERGLIFDFGLDPKRLKCIIPTSNLHTQLADGKSIPLEQLIECYCLHPGMRISTRVTRRADDEIEAWLSDRYMHRVEDWVATGLDRILVFDCFRKEAESAVLTTHLSRDVVAVESETLTLQSIVCKLGTDAVGLIPKLGHSLRKQKLKPFLPEKIIRRCRPW